MDKIELRRQLIPFEKECEHRGYPVCNLQVFDFAPGFIKFITDWSRDKSLVNTGMFLWKILDESVPPEISKRVWGVVPELSPDVMEQVRLERLAARKAVV